MFNILFGIGIVALQIFIVAVFIGWLAKAPFVRIIMRHSHTILRVIFVGAVIGSLIYEYGFGYAPCLLCWYQRIFIFSTTILLFTADIRTNKLLRRQLLILVLIGLAIALFHNYIDIFPTGLDVCGATGPSCLARYVYEFGYITIPVMSGSVLLAGTLLLSLAKHYPQEAVASSQ